MDVGDKSVLLKLRGSQPGRQACFAEIYKRYYKQTEAYVLKNNGTPDEAKDIFQEVMVTLLTKINDPNFELTSSLATYLYAISRNLWLNKLRKKGKTVNYQGYGEILPLTEEPESMESNLFSWLKQITDRCQEIIKALFFLSEPMAKLAVRMGWKNRHTADNQKYKCIQQLKKVTEKEGRLV